MPDLCDRPGCTVLMSTDPEPYDCGQTFGFMRRVGMHEGLPLVRIYCSTDCVEADRDSAHYGAHDARL